MIRPELWPTTPTPACLTMYVRLACIGANVDAVHVLSQTCPTQRKQILFSSQPARTEFPSDAAKATLVSPLVVSDHPPCLTTPITHL